MQQQYQLQAEEIGEKEKALHAYGLQVSKFSSALSRMEQELRQTRDEKVESTVASVNCLIIIILFLESFARREKCVASLVLQIGAGQSRADATGSNARCRGAAA